MSNLCDTLQQEGKYEQAEALYRNYLAGAPNSPVRINSLAWYLVSTRDHAQWRPLEAVELARRALQTSQNVDWVWNTLGLAEYRAGHMDEAIEALNRAVQSDGEADPTNFFFLAMAHWRRGDKEKGERFLQKGADIARNRMVNQPEWRMFWAEAAAVLGKAGPPKAD